MTILEIVLITILVLALILVGLMLIVTFRSDWVRGEYLKLIEETFRRKNQLIDQDRLTEAEELPWPTEEYVSYDRALFSFWIWDVEKFKKKRKRK